jgi:hypothetical protein
MVQSRYGQEVTGVQILPVEVQNEIARRQMVDAMLLMDAGLRAGETMTVGALADVSAGSPQGLYQAMTLVVTASATTAQF